MHPSYDWPVMRRLTRVAVHFAATRLIDFIVRSYFEQLNPTFLLTFDLNKVKDDPQVVCDIAGPMTIQLPF
jgi:hypothetical protein